jgi:hypothetical protein
MTEWSLWTLEHGLPELPDRVEVGETVPIARWVGGRFAAVMHVQWMWTDAHLRDYLSSETELFFRRGNSWETESSGGASWLDPPFRRPPSFGPREVLPLTQTGATVPDGYCWSIEGIAGTEAAFVEVIDLEGATRRAIESPFGAFVACTDGDHAATLRVLDRAGEALLTKRFSGDAGY